ncbi:MAG: hypothetical protein U9R79_21460 [Armatimonadota bacterium]|nr:hypothetical protein [Armatimonadota bacterium]
MHHLLTHITGLDMALAMLLLVLYLSQGRASRVPAAGGAEGDSQQEPSPPTEQ